jgi:predicted transcriptional regulator
MRRHEISQLPVIDARNAIRSLSERTITHRILSGRRPTDFSRLRVKQVIEDRFRW